MDGPPLCSGWLTKLGYKSGKWQSRYFVLSKRHMTYYAGIGGKLKGSISVDSMKGVQVVGENEPIDATACTSIPRRPVCDFAFKVETVTADGPRAFYFICTSEAERETWLARLHAARTGDQDTSSPQQQQQDQQRRQQQKMVFVPKSEATQRLNILRQPWFRRTASSADIKHYLHGAQAGAFAITDSPGRPGDFDLWIQTGDRVIKLLILHQSYKGLTCSGLQGARVLFEHILDFVFHYCRKPIRIRQLHNQRVYLSLSACSNAENNWRARHGTVSRPVVRPTQQRKQQSQRQRRLQQQQRREGMKGSHHQSSPSSSSAAASQHHRATVGTSDSVQSPASALEAAQDTIAAATADLSELSQRYASKKQKIDDLKVSVEISISSTDLRVRSAKDAYLALVSRASKVSARDAAKDTLAHVRAAIEAMGGEAEADTAELRATFAAMKDVVGAMETELAAFEEAIQTANASVQGALKHVRNGAAPGDVSSSMNVLNTTTRAAKDAFERLNSELMEHVLAVTDVLGRDHSVTEDLQGARTLVEKLEEQDKEERKEVDDDGGGDGDNAESQGGVAGGFDGGGEVSSGGAADETRVESAQEGMEEEEDDPSMLVAVDEDVFDALAVESSSSSDDDDGDDDGDEMKEEGKDTKEEDVEGKEEVEDGGERVVSDEDVRDHQRGGDDASVAVGTNKPDTSMHNVDDKEANGDGDGVHDHDEQAEEDTTTPTTAACAVQDAKQESGDVVSATDVNEHQQPTTSSATMTPAAKSDHSTTSNASTDTTTNTSAPTAAPTADNNNTATTGSSSDDDDDDDDDVVDLMVDQRPPAGEHSQRADEIAAKREERTRAQEFQRKKEEEEEEARAFLQTLLQEPIDGDLGDALKSGQILCRAMNVLSPNSVPRVSTSKLSFHQMENIGYFLSAVEGYGIRSSDSFQTVDLFERQNIPQVVRTLLHLKRIATQRGHMPTTKTANKSDTVTKPDTAAAAEKKGAVKAPAVKPKPKSTPTSTPKPAVGKKSQAAPRPPPPAVSPSPPPASSPAASLSASVSSASTAATPTPSSAAAPTTPTKQEAPPATDAAPEALETVAAKPKTQQQSTPPVRTFSMGGKSLPVPAKYRKQPNA
ncbi:hypothetical protein PTSG_05404 [Salpingoeca rosetta]|uniref:PH domain-containing protein n=1 Tax=Salpingoeca rosetta (strain ATCC 50818 / BSB-021) TaxID=946362 RepID=F2UAC1_SALR5|nr:uncharacterized protein PTSG_05404 [Salpingoeca rosetta]EGD73696.1 hypothetical protein PTSG_05404 [Salpingoeca rosetta]|eukprot:XP_004993977.1 hypothetical protein PTSG_05404 [Salpingoeca rosetta]